MLKTSLLLSLDFCVRYDISKIMSWNIERPSRDPRNTDQPANEITGCHNDDAISVRPISRLSVERRTSQGLDDEIGRKQVAQSPNTSFRARRAACMMCRQRKVRCGKQTPSCQRCTRFSQVCIYGVPGVAGRKPFPQVLKDVKSRLS